MKSICTPPESLHASARLNRRRLSRHHGVAIVLVIVAVAAAAVIGSAYIASQLNAPQIVGNVNSGIEARYIADSGADLATAIMECDTFDWRTAQAAGVLVDNLPIGNGSVTIEVKDISGGNPDSQCEFPIIVSRGNSGSMRQFVGAIAHTPVPDRVEDTVSVDLSEFAVFGATSIDVIDGWVMRWEAAPKSAIGLPLKLGTNGLTDNSLKLRGKANAPDSEGYVLATATSRVISDSQSGTPIRRIDVTTNEPIPVPAAPTPNLNGILWASTRSPAITSNTSLTVTSARRYNSISVDAAATLAIDLAGGSRTIGISGPLTIKGGGVIRIDNGHVDLVVQGAFNMLTGGALELGPNASMTIFLGGTMSIDDSVIGLPASLIAKTRVASDGLAEYHDPNRCVIYRITSINSVDLNLLDFDDAASWVWSDSTVKSWMIDHNSFVCGRLYGRNKVSLSLDHDSAIFGNVITNAFILDHKGAVYYDPSLDLGNGYTNPTSRLFAAPLDLRDDIKLALTDLNDSTIASVLALLSGGPPPPPVAIDPSAPTPRDKKRVSKRWWKHYGAKVKRDRQSPVEDVIASN